MRARISPSSRPIAKSAAWPKPPSETTRCRVQPVAALRRGGLIFGIPPPSWLSMPQFETRHVVQHSPGRMFDLVADVERYPEFVPLCEALHVRGRRDNDDGTSILVADMTVAYKLFRETFTSRVTLVPHKGEILVEYLDGRSVILKTGGRSVRAGRMPARSDSTSITSSRAGRCRRSCRRCSTGRSASSRPPSRSAPTTCMARPEIRSAQSGQREW